MLGPLGSVSRGPPCSPLVRPARSNWFTPRRAAPRHGVCVHATALAEPVRVVPPPTPLLAPRLEGRLVSPHAPERYKSSEFAGLSGMEPSMSS